MSRKFVEVRDVTLGIDIGSTSTRAYLRCPATNDGWHVENTADELFVMNGDFSSVGYPFKSRGPVYIGEQADPTSQEVSLKYAFYPLAGASDELLEQYLLVRPLMERKSDANFLKRLREGLEGLLSTIERNVKNIQVRRRVQVTRIGLSIPSQWTLEFEDVYRDIVSRVFKHPPDSIFFHTETEALAHFLLEEGLDYLQPEKQDEYSVFLFLDLGGHNMNGCTFNLVYGSDNSASFYRIGEPFGVGGGSEHWTFNIGEKCLEYVIETEGNHVTLTPEEKHEMLESFNRQKNNLGPLRGSKPFRFAGLGGWNVKLPPDEVAGCFEVALRRVFESAELHIQAASKFKATPQVVVSGGTAKHAAVKARLERICEKAGVPAPHFVTGSSMMYSSGRIAKGVALAASNCLTVEQFMARGAAFGQQMKQSANRGNTNPDDQWDNFAPFLLSQSRQETIKFNAQGNDEFKIICDPFFETQPGRTNLHYDRCYDILYLGKAKGGVRTLTLSLVDHNGLACLVIKTTRVWFAGAKRGRKKRCIKQHSQEENEQRESPPLPLYFDGGTNCAHLDLKGFDITTLGFGSTSTNTETDIDLAQSASDEMGKASTPSVNVPTPKITTHAAVDQSNLPTSSSRFVPIEDIQLPPTPSHIKMKISKESEGVFSEMHCRRSKPKWRRGEAPEFDPYVGQIHLPMQQSKLLTANFAARNANKRKDPL